MTFEALCMTGIAARGDTLGRAEHLAEVTQIIESNRECCLGHATPVLKQRSCDIEPDLP